MSRIRVLDEHTINKIAAGEVIENPASVVKELVENALDAGSTEISVEIAGGGRQLIRISDNGCGMSADDAVLCLERHATSKIRNVEDIHEILTMGFRGEAIPSIASISKFTILTTPYKEGDKNCQGSMVIVEGGRLISCSPAARSQGTTMEVKSLFFNMPVRKKFQKSPTYDAQEILKILTILSLGYPHIKFELISDQKLLLDTSLLPSDHSFQEKLGFRIESILGREFLASLCPVSFKNENFTLEGYVGLPSHHRQNRTGQYLFINQRAVQSPLISFAIREGYGTMLGSNRHPVFVLHLQMPGSLLDVNVHPQKKEVRIRQDHKLKEYIIEAIQKALQKNNFAEENEEKAIHYENFSSPSPSQSYQNLLSPPFNSPAHPPANLRITELSSIPENLFGETQYESKPFAEISVPPFFATKTRPTPIPESSQTFQFISKKLQPRILAAVPGYLLLDPLSIDPNSFPNLSLRASEGFCVVNQRAAYARIFYERSLNHSTKPQGIQTLLIPITIEFSNLESVLLLEHLSVLQSMGFGIKEFGENTFIIDSVPDLLKNEKLEACITAIVQDLREFQDTKRLQREREKQIALLACRNSLSGNRKLSIEEAQGLLTQLLDCQTPSQCPMGRSTIINLTSDDLSKLFQG